MKKSIRFSLTAIITMFMCLIIAPSAFAEDTVYTTSDVTGGVRIDSVTTTETKLVIPDEIGGKVVVVLGAEAFAGTPVEEITVPACVTSMSGRYDSAFACITNLEKVTFAEGMRTIPENALANCTTVTEVVLPESLTAISSKAFYECSALKTINLPDSITTIGEAAFCKCTSLTDIKLSKKLTILGEGAFAKCTELKKIILPEALKTIECLAFYQTQISEITIPASIEKMYSHGSVDNIDGIYSRDFSALYGMNYLEKVIFADGMKTVPSNAIKDCEYIEEVVIYDCNESLEAMKTTATEKDFKLTVLPCSGCHHRITEIRNTIEATCSANGYTGDTCCKDCGIIIEKGTETEKTAHTEVPVKGFDSDCANKGLTDGTKCSICNAVMKAQQEIPVKGHTFGEWTLVKAPTATEKGKEERKCSVCGKTETRAVEKLDYLIGDVNGDGKITAADARIVLRVSAKLENMEKYNRPFEVFDIICDGKITAADARKILRISAKLE